MRFICAERKRCATDVADATKEAGPSGRPMATVTVSEAKTRFGELLERVPRAKRVDGRLVYPHVNQGRAVTRLAQVVDRKSV